ncbi:hypothetical protein VB774_08195 [Pseudanabaena galeata UHCC 0370]|uniref:Uncharacterized protein n=1 Tax=Pseudanabaena galeata UHCC 0370 TaxID=3110310 RepID=A0ABU5TH73_9CYAN|nr:hypothetical protein [Pseudanabaena galeata]MEA5477599.1 hypothetical protein [Pseudanabaena galeata UHCC 0370]
MKTILVFPEPKAQEIPKSFFLKARQRRAFKKTIFIMRITETPPTLIIELHASLTFLFFISDRFISAL